jgi:hypothetical protein
MLQARRSPVQVPDEVDFFNLPNPSSSTMVLGLTQSVTEISTKNLLGGKKRPARRADNLATIYGQMSENVGASTSHNSKGLYRGNFTFYLSHGKETECIRMMSKQQLLANITVSISVYFASEG